MNIRVCGNVIEFDTTPDDTDILTPYHLPDGYSLGNITVEGNNMGISIPGRNPFYPTQIGSGKIPVVDGKSPCYFNIYHIDTTKSGWLALTIHEFGMEPSVNYWQREFKPVVRKRADGTEYNIIPAGQFGVGG